MMSYFVSGPLVLLILVLVSKSYFVSAASVFLILVLALMAATDDRKTEQRKEW